MNALTPVLRRYSGLEKFAAQGFDAEAFQGFSGGCVWRVQTEQGLLAIRQWPPNFDRRRLQYIHEMLKQLAPEQLPIPIPLVARDASTWVLHDGVPWEAEPWMPGQANYWSDPSDDKLRNAFAMLARLHLATERIATSTDNGCPAIARRINSLSRHLSLLPQYVDVVQRQGSNNNARAGISICDYARRFASAWQERLARSESLRFRLLPCLRDIWHDHMLFTDQDVSGIIDFGSLDIDNPATDLARLVGSLVADDDSARQRGITSYQATRRMDAAEVELIDVLDRSGVLVAGLNWIQWLWIERREFPSLPAAFERLQQIARRLTHPAFADVT